MYNKKPFSIVKAFEFAFDLLVHHHVTFLRFLIIVGGLTWAGHYLGQRYLKPAIRDMFTHVENRIIVSEFAKRLGLDKKIMESPQYKSFRKALTGFLDRTSSVVVVTTIKKETGKAVVDRIVAKLEPGATTTVTERPAVSQDNHVILWGLLALLLGYIGAVFLMLFTLRLAIAFYSFHTINVSHALHLVFRLLPVGLLAFLLYELLVSLGLILLIIPGIILALRYSQIIPLLADERAISVREAFSMSAECTNGAKWHLLFFSILIWLIHDFALYLGWGMIIAGPILTLVIIHVYYQLLEKSPKVLAEGHTEATIGA